VEACPTNRAGQAKEFIMMGWYSGDGMGSLGWLGMGVFWLILLGLIVWLVVRLLPDSSSSSSPARGKGDSALDILDRRLANGQLDLPSWQAQRAALLGVQDIKK
jgi:putative membrane protein